MPVVRGEAWELSLAPQFSESAITDVVYSDGVIYPSYITHIPGIFNAARLPDPDLDRKSVV